MRKPEVIYCPNCKSWSVNRRNGKCIHCGIELYYGGELVPSDSKGYIWFEKIGYWIKVEEWIKR